MKQFLKYNIPVALSVLVSLFAFYTYAVWNPPTLAPPLGNTDPPLAGGTTPLDVTQSGGERDITNINALIGDGDLFVRSNSAEDQTTYYGAYNHRFYTAGIEKLRILNNGNLQIFSNIGNIGTTGIGGISLTGTAWQGIGMDGDASTKSFLLHYGDSADNAVRFGRYADNLGIWEANPIQFDLDAPDGALLLDATANLTAAGDICSNNGINCLNAIAGGANLWKDLGSGNIETTTATGNVGIGTTGSPNAKAHIDFSSIDPLEQLGLKVNLNGANGDTILLLSADDGSIAGGSDFIRAEDGGAGLFVVEGDGDVGIGTASPGAKLQVESAGNTAVRIIAGNTNFSSLNFGDPDDSAIGSIQYDHTAESLNLLVAGQPFGIHLDQSTGNVGIGTATPGFDLDVNGDANATQLCIAGTCQSSWASISGPWTKTAGNIYPATLTDNVGIGTASPAGAKLQVESPGNTAVRIIAGNTNFSSLNFGDPDDSAIGSIQYDHTAESLNFLVAGQPFGIHLDQSTGNVGIGTATPGFDLDVNGTANISGKLTVTTIDPVYEIGGKKYATYVADTAGGVTTETSGVWRMTEAPKKIDFDELETGSNLWLFWNTIIQDLENVVVLLTPGFDGNVWYEKNTEENTLTIHSTKNGEVSFRLTAPREDADKWENEIEK
jgi:hypothetical protein